MLNLDTHILLHALLNQGTPRERRLLADAPWSISAIVLWEITKLAQMGRILVDLDSPEFNEIRQTVQIWPIDFAVCRAIHSLDFRADPADEIIAATSIALGIPLLTRDARILASKVVPLA